MTALVIDATELFRKRRSAQRAIRDAFEKNRREHIERLIADEFTCAKCGEHIAIYETECGACPARDEYSGPETQQEADE